MDRIRILGARVPVKGGTSLSEDHFVIQEDVALTKILSILLILSKIEIGPAPESR